MIGAGATDLGARLRGAAFVFFAALRAGAAFFAVFLAAFFAVFFAVFLADFFADFLADFFAVFLAAFFAPFLFFATTTFLAFFDFLAFFAFLDFFAIHHPPVAADPVTPRALRSSLPDRALPLTTPRAITPDACVCLS